MLYYLDRLLVSLVGVIDKSKSTGKAASNQQCQCRIKAFGEQTKLDRNDPQMMGKTLNIF